MFVSSSNLSKIELFVSTGESTEDSTEESNAVEGEDISLLYIEMSLDSLVSLSLYGVCGVCGF